jgi:ppGpp synthetase/RelA/SpoT-type nucleotidyltranferase
MPERTVEDRLRKEYFDLLPDIRRVTEHLEAETKHRLLSISRKLDKYEQVTVRSRIKECESALDSLRRRQQGRIFDRAEQYTLTKLKDLAAVRVLVFPRSRIAEADTALRPIFESPTADPILGASGETLALKYWGYCPERAAVFRESTRSCRC